MSTTDFWVTLGLEEDAEKSTWWQCPACSFPLVHRDEARAWAESQVKTVVCEICNKRYKNKWVLATHMAGVHGGQTWKCFCGKEWKSRGHYDKCMKKHAPDVHPTVIDAMQAIEGPADAGAPAAEQVNTE